jgi:hypothetical protein
MSWNRTRFSQWEVEGEVRQRVGKALAEAEQDRMANQCQEAKERPVGAGAMGWLKAGFGILMVRAGSWVRAPHAVDRGTGEAKG